MQSMLQVGIFEVGSSRVICINPWLLQKGISKDVRKQKIIKTINIKQANQKKKTASLCVSVGKRMASGFNEQCIETIFWAFYFIPEIGA